MTVAIKWPFTFGLVGIPDDQGVFNVGGKMGAAQGPVAFQRIFSKFKGRVPIDSLPFTNVAGLGADVARNHALAAQAVSRVHQPAPDTAISIVVGGGHDHGFSHLQGLASAHPGKRLACINVDAHLDVREAKPLITSGSPFYLALESGIVRGEDLIEFGIQSHCNAPSLWQYAREKGVAVVEFRQLRPAQAVARFTELLTQLAKRVDLVAVSFDLDAAAEAYAPGVSAPQAEGFTSGEMIAMAEAAAREAKVRSIGIFELNPFHDVQDRTARLAATMAYHFIESKFLTD